MSNKFIPVSLEQGESLKESLSNTIFKSPEDFVKLYNSEIINKKNDEVRKILDEITSVFKNVREQGGDLIFLSESEIALSELLSALRPWGILVKAKRVVSSAVEQGLLDAGDSIAFSKKHSGLVLKVNISEEDQIVLEKVDSEKIYSKFEELEEIFSLNILTGELEDGVVILDAQQVLDINEDFLLKAHALAV